MILELNICLFKICLVTRLNYKIYVFVEGGDDLRFFQSVIKPELEKQYRSVHISSYKNQRKSELENLINNIHKNNMPYIFVADLDKKVCSTETKKFIKKQIPKIVDKQIIVVKHEIESWYVAGLEYKDASSLNVVYHTNTESITKEIFNSMITPDVRSRNLFLIKILEKFSIATAKKHNPSFAYFCDKFL